MEALLTTNGWVIGLLIVVALAIFLFVREENRTARELRDLYESYQLALKSGDKVHAVNVGRTYYLAKRNGHPLTAADEQAITNDLTTIR